MPTATPQPGDTIHCGPWSATIISAEPGRWPTWRFVVQHGSGKPQPVLLTPSQFTVTRKG